MIGVLGGSGFGALLEEPRELLVPTPYGSPSGPVTVGLLAGRRVAFLLRHGPGHTIPPHRIPYRANVWALASLGVRALVSSSAVGGLGEHVPPGTFVVPDQYLDLTSGRARTFFDGPLVHHLAAPDPFDPVLRASAIAVLEEQRVPLRTTGTTVVIDGPRFATRAESRWYRAAGGDTVNMTLVPETPLALELGIGVVNCSFVTDSDAAVDAGHEDGVTAELVFARLAAARPVVHAAVTEIVRRIPPDFSSAPGAGADAVAEVLARSVRP